VSAGGRPHSLSRQSNDRFKLKKGDSVDVPAHPQTGAIVARTGHVLALNQARVSRQS